MDLLNDVRERLTCLMRKVNNMDREDRDILIELKTDIKYIREKLENFVTKDEFKPVRLIAYGLVASLVGLIIAYIRTGI